MGNHLLTQQLHVMSRSTLLGHLLVTSFSAHAINFHLGMLKPEEQDDSNNATPVVDHLEVLVQRFGHLLKLRNRNVDYPQGAQVQRELEQTLKLFEATFPR
ncbi:MAG: hypothetical protein BYD32DRAFT_209999 [Podila humilis]|nr:MAG: hypothetical protein BYD32DRAFT_209999 [Podila humilis]